MKSDKIFIGLFYLFVSLSDPRYFTSSSENALRVLEEYMENSLANAPQTINVANSAGATAVVERNLEIIFAVDLSNDVNYEELKSALKYAEEHVKKVSTVGFTIEPNAVYLVCNELKMIAFCQKPV